MREFGFVLMAALALGALVAVYLAERQRAAAIRALAIRSGFHYIGEALPRSLTLNGTPLERASKVWNVIDGEPHGIRIIAFDCRVGVGRGSWRRTVIAVERGSNLSLLLNPEMKMDFVGSWKVLYRPQASTNFRIAGLMPVTELESYLNSVAADGTKSSQRV
jgi:hypothetical protein